MFVPMNTIPGPYYVCHPRMVGAIKSWRKDTRPSRLPRFIHRLLIVLF